MNFKVLILFICLSFPYGLAKAEDHGDFRILKNLKVSKGQAAILVREDGHLLGQPYQVELRVDCSGQKSDPLAWDVRDSFSVCDLKPDSLKLNKKGDALALKTKMADLEKYNSQIDQGEVSPEVQCLEKTKVQKFSLRFLCED